MWLPGQQGEGKDRHRGREEQPKETLRHKMRTKSGSARAHKASVVVVGSVAEKNIV